MGSAAPSRSIAVRRALIAAALLLAEYALIAALFDIAPAEQRGGVWSGLSVLRDAGVWTVLAAVGATLAASHVAGSAATAQRELHRSALVAAHAAAFVTFAGLTWFVLARPQVPAGSPTAWLAAWGGVGLLSSILLFVACVGPGLLQLRVIPYALAGGLVGVVGYGAGELARFGWAPLASLTFVVSEALLSLVFRDVIANRPERVLGVGDFSVWIDAPCSGYEGLGLMLVLLPTYLIAFRRRLHFPRAFWLLPLGMVAVWLGNALRIAALIALGSLVDPDLAVNGFHSKAGWVFFAGITLGVAAIGNSAHYFARDQESRASDFENPAAPYLVPLLVLTATGLVTGLFADSVDRWYGLRVALGAAALWYYRDSYRHLLRQSTWRGAVVGCLMAAAWLAPFRAGPPSPVGETVSNLWLVGRIVGSVLVVPLVEELAFRGYLLRRLQSSDFTNVSWRGWTWVSLVGSSLVFGILHQRWLAGSLAGLVYAMLLVRTGRLGESALAHAVTNALIAAWVLGTGDWSHWI